MTFRGHLEWGYQSKMNDVEIVLNELSRGGAKRYEQKSPREWRGINKKGSCPTFEIFYSNQRALSSKIF